MAAKRSGKKMTMPQQVRLHTACSQLVHQTGDLMVLIKLAGKRHGEFEGNFRLAVRKIEEAEAILRGVMKIVEESDE